MKILRVTSIGYEGGGADNGMILLQPVLEKMGHTVKILASDLRPDLPHFNDLSFKALSSQPTFLRFLYRSFYPSSYLALKKVLKSYNPDIVQLHTMAEVSPSVLFLLKNYPTVMTIHGAEDFTKELLLWSFPPYFFKNGVYERKALTLSGRLHYFYHRYINGTIYRLGFKNIDAFIVFSKYMQSQLRKEGINAEHIPNATRLFEYAPVDTDSKVILSVGRVEKFKGIDYVIRALPQIIAVHPATQLLIAGTGDYEGALEELVKELGMERYVRFLGRQSRDQLYEQYRHSAVVVVPSTWPEPFGKVGIEAMSVGRPVVASDIGGISEWLDDGKTGYLVPPADTEAIAEKIIKIFSDKALLHAFSLNARKRSEDFTIEGHAKRIVAFYEKIIKEHHEKHDGAGKKTL